MKKYGKAGRPGKRRRNMPGYHLGINKIGRKSWFANRRPQDIEKVVMRHNFSDGSIKPGTLFALSKTSNAIFLGTHRGRILYYNPKTDRVGHTSFGRSNSNRKILILKERAGLDYFKSENDWMNHRKIPGSDLKVSDVFTNPYRKTIAKKPGDQFTMLDYHKSAIVGDILQGNQTGLKAEVIAITKRGMTVKVDDGTPTGRIGQINLKNRAYLDRQYTLVKSAINKDTQVKDLQDKVNKISYDTVETVGGGGVAVSRGRPAGSTNRPLTEEEKETFRKKMNESIEKFDAIESEDPREHLKHVKNIISHSNKIDDQVINEKYKKVRQQLNYKITLHDKYDDAQTPEEKLAAAKAALKYEERIGGRDSAKNMWRERIAALNGEKPESNKKTVAEEAGAGDSDVSNKKLIAKLDEEAKQNENDMIFVIGRGWIEQDKPSDINYVRSQISRIENMLSMNAYPDGRALESHRRISLLGQRRGFYDRLNFLTSEKNNETKKQEPKETVKTVENVKKVVDKIESEKNSEQKNPDKEDSGRTESGAPKLEAEYGDDLELAKKLNEEAEKYKVQFSFKYGYEKIGEWSMLQSETKHIESIRSLISEIEGVLSRNKWSQYDEEAFDSYSMFGKNKRRDIIGRPKHRSFNPENELTESGRAELLGRRQWLIDSIKPNRVDQERQAKINKDSENYKNNLNYREGRRVVDDDVSFFLRKNGNLDVLKIESEIAEIENRFKLDEYYSLKLTEEDKGFMHGRRDALTGLLKNNNINKTKVKLDIPSSLEKEFEEHKDDPIFLKAYNEHKSLDRMWTFIRNVQGGWDRQLSEIKNALETNYDYYTGGLYPLSKKDRTTLLATYKAMLEMKQAREREATANKTNVDTQKNNAQQTTDTEKQSNLVEQKFKGYNRLGYSDLSRLQVGEKFFAYDRYSNKIIEVNVEGGAYGGKVFRTPVLEKGIPTDKAALDIGSSSGMNDDFIALSKSNDPEYHPSKLHSLVAGDLVYVKNSSARSVKQPCRVITTYSGEFFAQPLDGSASFGLDNLNDDNYDIIPTPKSATSALNILRNLTDKTHLVVHTENGNLATTINKSEISYDEDSKSLKIKLELTDSKNKVHLINVDGENISKNNLFDLNTSISSVKLKQPAGSGDRGSFLDSFKKYGVENAIAHLSVPGLENEISITDNYTSGKSFVYSNNLKINGANAGRIERKFYTNSWGERAIHNEIFKLPPFLQGDNIAQRIYDNQVKLAKKLDVEYFDMVCALDVGGYAWATRKKGFNFSDSSQAARFKDQLINLVNNMTISEWREFHPTATQEVMQKQKDLILKELRKFALDANGNQTNKKYYDAAKAYEFAEFTHKYKDENGNEVVVGKKRKPTGYGRDDRLHHLGKSLLLGNYWTGIKSITDPKYNKPEWDISTIEAPVPSNAVT